jgi:hypothetical protein
VVVVVHKAAKKVPMKVIAGVGAKGWELREWLVFKKNCRLLQLPVFGLSDGATNEERRILRTAQDRLALANAVGREETASSANIAGGGTGGKEIAAGLLSGVERKRIVRVLEGTEERCYGGWAFTKGGLKERKKAEGPSLSSFASTDGRKVNKQQQQQHEKGAKPKRAKPKAGAAGARVRKPLGEAINLV